MADTEGSAASEQQSELEKLRKELSELKEGLGEEKRKQDEKERGGWPWFRDRVLPGIVGAGALGVLALIGNALSDGTAVTWLGGMAKAEVEQLVGSVAATPDVLPAGAVVAINSSETEPCPGDDWKLYDDARGRFIVGAGHGDRSRPILKIGEAAGEATIEILLENLPEHGHALRITPHKDIPEDGANAVELFNIGSPTGTLQPTFHGEGRAMAGKAINSMPPFVALYFCEYRSAT